MEYKSEMCWLEIEPSDKAKTLRLYKLYCDEYNFYHNPKVPICLYYNIVDSITYFESTMKFTDVLFSNALYDLLLLIKEEKNNQECTCLCTKANKEKIRLSDKKIDEYRSHFNDGIEKLRYR